MGVPIRLTIVGEEELGRKIKQLTAKVGKAALIEAVKEGAEIVRVDASARAPRRTGYLAGHINTRISQRRKGKVTVDIGPDKSAWYGIFPELGTIHYSARPYLRPAIDENQNRVVDTVKNRLKREIAAAAKK